MGFNIKPLLSVGSKIVFKRILDCDLAQVSRDEVVLNLEYPYHQPPKSIDSQTNIVVTLSMVCCFTIVK